MSVTVNHTGGAPGMAPLELDWEGPRHNVSRNLSKLHALLPRELSPLCLDLVDIATAVYMTDIAVLRGRNEQWVRNLSLTVPVREPGFWRERASDLSYLLYVLTHDGVQFEFTKRDGTGEQPTAKRVAFAGDCVSLLSGGIDSLAGAVMLIRTGRRPVFVSHHSGNPTVMAAQGAVHDMLSGLGTGDRSEAFQTADIRLAVNGHGSPATLPFPPTALREPSQRSRSMLFMSLAVAAAHGQGVREAFVFENGILTVALPLCSARLGGLSTRSTHPRVIALMNELCHHAGLDCELLNPFIYQTKAEIIRDILRPALAPFDIQRTVSCWAAGRASRQCGGCLACLIRRLSMLAAGLPDEAYEVDVLADPDACAGTDAYVNLVDLLSQCGDFLRGSDMDLLRMAPELLDLQPGGVSLPEVLAMYRRYANEITDTVRTHFPRTARLLDRCCR